MIRSMTAFARKEAHEPWGILSWELRTVNHRFLEVSSRLPEELRDLDGPLRERTRKFLKRGKLDATLRFQATILAEGEIPVNKELAKRLVQAAVQLETLLGRPSAPVDILDFLRWPGVLDMQALDLEPVRLRALELLDSALAEIVESRSREGKQMQTLILKRCDAMEAEVDQVRERMPAVLSRVRTRLTERLAELQTQIDAERLEQEVVLLTHKLDVEEEMDRLRAHIIEVRRVLGQTQPVGRRLDFLMQELNREANTLGSKSADIETTRSSVEMKVLIEQMREQIQNIE